MTGSALLVAPTVVTPSVSTHVGQSSSVAILVPQWMVTVSSLGLTSRTGTRLLSFGLTTALATIAAICLERSPSISQTFPSTPAGSPLTVPVTSITQNSRRLFECHSCLHGTGREVSGATELDNYSAVSKLQLLVLSVQGTAMDFHEISL